MATQMYNDPANSSPSSIGNQTRTDYYQKKALIELKKEQYFSQLADVTTMPKNMGKKIKMFHYIPMLDDRNINDQGIDAAGVVMTNTQYSVQLPWTSATDYMFPRKSEPIGVGTGAGVTTNAYAVDDYFFCPKDTTWYKAASAIAVGATITAGGNATATNYAAIKALLEADAGASVAPEVTATVNISGIKTDISNVVYATQAAALVAANIVGGAIVAQRSGNLYGSSKDIGSISGKLPALSESGGRVNRVGHKRMDLEGTFEKFGFFDEYTQESLDFDSDEELEMHINREMLNAANEMTEDALQVDLLNSAGVIRYAGSATKNSECAATSVVSYGDLMRLSIDLDNNRTPKHTTVITGSRMVDTQTVNAARLLYVGSELLPTLKAMNDLHSNPAFISVEKYADAGSPVNGEVGAIDQFRIVVVPEMAKWSGAGAVTTEATHYSTNNRYDVFPMLCIGEKSFTTIGFQTDGKGVKFTIFNKKPGLDTADVNNPYGEVGFMSIKWYYGFMVLRPERIGLIKTIASL